MFCVNDVTQVADVTVTVYTVVVVGETVIVALVSLLLHK